jgi:hypothetical protein
MQVKHRCILQKTIHNGHVKQPISKCFVPIESWHHGTNQTLAPQLRKVQHRSVLTVQFPQCGGCLVVLRCDFNSSILASSLAFWIPMSDFQQNQQIQNKLSSVENTQEMHMYRSQPWIAAPKPASGSTPPSAIRHQSRANDRHSLASSKDIKTF